MDNKELMEALNKANSKKEAYDICVNNAGLKMSYDEFCEKISGKIQEEGCLSENELDLVSGGFFGIQLSASFKKTEDNIIIDESLSPKRK